MIHAPRLQIRAKGVLDLGAIVDCRLEMEAEVQGSAFELQVEGRQAGTYRLEASTPVESLRWVKAIRQAIRQVYSCERACYFTWLCVKHVHRFDLHETRALLWEGANITSSNDVHSKIPTF